MPFIAAVCALPGSFERRIKGKTKCSFGSSEVSRTRRGIGAQGFKAIVAIEDAQGIKVGGKEHNGGMCRTSANRKEAR